MTRANDDTADPPRRMAPGHWNALLWLALLFAFAPSLIHWWRSLAESSAERIYALSLAWLAIAAWRSDRVERRTTLGAALLAGALVIQMAALTAGVEGLATSAIPLACLGMAAWQGWPRLQSACLAFWCVPLPYSLIELGTPALESIQAAAGSGLGAALGLPSEAPSGPLFLADGARLELSPFDAGYSLAVGLSSAVWLGDALRKTALWRASLRCGIAALAALPIQTVLVAIAVALLAGGDADAARGTLLVGPWALSIALAALLSLRHAGGSSGDRSHPTSPRGT